MTCPHTLTYAYLPAALFWPLVQAVGVRPEGDVRVQLEAGQTAFMDQMQPIFRCSATFLVGARSAPAVPTVYFSVPPGPRIRPKDPQFQGMVKRRPSTTSPPVRRRPVLSPALVAGGATCQTPANVVSPLKHRVSVDRRLRARRVR